MVATYKLPVARGDFCAAEICILGILIGGASDNSSLAETLVFLLSLVLLDFFELEALFDFFFFFLLFLVFFISSDSSLESFVSGFFLLLPDFALR